MSKEVAILSEHWMIEPVSSCSQKGTKGGDGVFIFFMFVHTLLGPLSFTSSMNLDNAAFGIM